VVPEYADLVVAGKNDTAVAVFELGKLRNEFLGHRYRTSGITLWASHLGVSSCGLCASGHCLFWLFGAR
jgi:hypothetical protein